MVLPQQSNNSGGCLCTSLAWFWQRICCSRWEWPGYGCLSNSCASICRVFFSFFDHLIYCFLGSFILSYISWAQHTISCIHASHNRLTSLFRCISSDASACLLVASLHYFAMVCSCHLPALCIGMEYLRTNNLNLAEQVSAYSTFPHLDSLNFTSSRVSDFCCICCKNDILMHVL